MKKNNAIFKTAGHPQLSKSYKGVFPFNIGTTSFIYPDDYVPNVKMLGPYLDEIELLLFESRPANVLPSKSVIAELSRLAAVHNLTYNIHLPIDVSVSDPRPQKQQQAVDTILNVFDLTEPLRPTAYTLHIPYGINLSGTEKSGHWQDRVFRNLEKLVTGGIRPQSIAVETLDFPLDLLDGIIDDLDLSICLDLGHLMAGAVDIKSVYKRYRSKTTIIHLHAFKKDRDHLALDQLSTEYIQAALWILRQFTRTVSLEVFSFESLQASLAFLEKHWQSKAGISG